VKSVEAYPLNWPPNRPRQHGRETAQFRVPLSRSVTDVQREVSMLGGTELIISTNMPLRKDGLPFSKYTLYDTGAAVYFTYKKKPVCFACDRWSDLAANMRAIVKTIEALRGIDRWGTGDMVSQAFTGFTALPAIEQWWQILGVKSDATFAQIEAAYRKLASVAHPDHPNGDEQWMSRINRARDQAMEQFE
jgi:hypothetical protein